MDRPALRLTGVVLGSPDPSALAAFYERLLGWPRHTDEPEWVTLHDPRGGAGLSFQLEDPYVAPTWPEGDPPMQVHLDVLVDDLEAAGAFARSVGARLAEHQPQDDVLVHLDPDGHPFCLYVD